MPKIKNSLTIKSLKNPSNKIVNKHKPDKQDWQKRQKKKKKTQKTQKSKLKEKVENFKEKRIYNAGSNEYWNMKKKKNLEESKGVRTKKILDLRVLRENLAAPASVGFICVRPEKVRRHYSFTFLSLSHLSFLFYNTSSPLLSSLSYCFCFVCLLSSTVFQKKPTKNTNVRMSCVCEERRIILRLETALTLCYVCLDLIGRHPRFYSYASTSSRAHRYHSLWDILF